MEPRDAPAFLREKIPGTRGTRATSHSEPDDQGVDYNNNLSYAEFIDWSPGTKITYDGTTGDQPMLDAKWGADKEDANYAHWYLDHDYYYVYLEEGGSAYDLINVTIEGDYGTDQGGGVRSWREMGLEMRILTGSNSIN